MYKNEAEGSGLSMEDRILSFLKENPGSRINDIAGSLGIGRRDTVTLLYGKLRDRCKLDANYQWYLKEDFPEPKKPLLQPNDTLLSRLCKYYLLCVDVDTGREVVVAQNKFGSEYKELDILPISPEDAAGILESDEVRGFINTVREDSSFSLYFGYPTLLSQGKLIPLFLFPIVVTDETEELDVKFPIINHAIWKEFMKMKDWELTQRINFLEDELGLSGETQPMLDELAMNFERLHSEWKWAEKINPHELTKNPPIQNCSTQGILNRAIVAKVADSPNNFTKGLEYELGKLSKLSDREYAGTALDQWINKKVQENTEDTTDPLLEVFPMNLEQRKAVRSSLSNDLTVITGPPGTGKSNVVANLIINAAWQKKRVLFVSKNNKAVDVVESRVNGVGASPFLLRLGNADTGRGQLVSHLTNILSKTTEERGDAEFERKKQEFETIHASLLTVDSQINSFRSLRNAVDRLDSKVDDIRDKSPKMFTFVKEGEFSKVKHAIQILIDDLGHIKKKSFFELLCSPFKGGGAEKNVAEGIEDIGHVISYFGIQTPSLPVDKSDMEQWKNFKDYLYDFLIQAERVEEYLSALRELQNADSLEELTKTRMNTLKRMSGKSLNLWRLWLNLRIKRLTSKDRSVLGQYRTVIGMVTNPNVGSREWKKYYTLSEKVSHILPAWAVTSLSAKGRIPFNKNVFDMVIFDESSQCDIASALPLLYRAKQAVIIGDPKQLPHISSIPKDRDRQFLKRCELFDNYSDWAYSYNSLFDLAAPLSNSIVNLRDHYRSHADIIGFSNIYFYGGSLRVATNHESLKGVKGRQMGVRFIDVRGSVEKGNLGGSQNSEEAQSVIMVLQKMYEYGYNGTIGVISPFRAQANIIRRLVHENHQISSWLSSYESRFISETAHRFQGDERDVIIFSPVISDGMSRSSKWFLETEKNLFNVAITRARAVLFVVGNRGAMLNSGIEHLEEFAKYVNKISEQNERKMARDSDLGAEYPTVSNPERVSDWERIFYKELYAAGVTAIPQYQEGIHTLDFAVFDGDRKLNVEVDGEGFHKDWTGELCHRDRIRNQRLFEMGWDVMRFWVYEVKDDPEGCVRKVREWGSRGGL